MASAMPAGPGRLRDLGPEPAAGRPPILRAGPDTVPVDVKGWTDDHHVALREVVQRQGAVLIRGLDLDGPATVATISRRIAGPAVPDREGFARRRALGPEVFSTLEWPAQQPMCMHHEMSYALTFPGSLTIGCLTSSHTGGATALADAERMLERLPAALVGRFADQGWILTRSYNDLVGLPWQEAFGTTDRAQVEDYCRRNAIQFSWEPGGGLRTSQRRAAVVTHPRTGRPCWFNQIAFLNRWTLDPAVREYLTFEFGPEGLPFDTYYGDGEPVGADVVEAINDVYETLTVREPWQDGDVLLVDNIRMAHNREPYEGVRETAVAFGMPVHLGECISDLRTVQAVTSTHLR